MRDKALWWLIVSAWHDREEEVLTEELSPSDWPSPVLVDGGGCSPLWVALLLGRRSWALNASEHKQEDTGERRLSEAFDSLPALTSLTGGPWWTGKSLPPTGHFWSQQKANKNRDDYQVVGILLWQTWSCCFAKGCGNIWNFGAKRHLSYFSITVKRGQDQGNLYKKAFNWGIAYRFRGWVHDHHDGSIATGLALEQ